MLGDRCPVAGEIRILQDAGFHPEQGRRAKSAQSLDIAPPLVASLLLRARRVAPREVRNAYKTRSYAFWRYSRNPPRPPFALRRPYLRRRVHSPPTLAPLPLSPLPRPPPVPPKEVHVPTSGASGEAGSLDPEASPCCPLRHRTEPELSGWHRHRHSCLCLVYRSASHSQEWLCHLAPCAGPRPLFRFFHQAGSDGIPLNVTPNSVQFRLASQPAIEGFILPERFAHATESGVGVPRRNPFDSVCDASQSKMRLQEHMDVVGHYYVGAQIILPQFGATNNGRFDIACDFRVSKPERAVRSAVELSVNSSKSLSPVLALRGTGTLAGAVEVGTARSGCATAGHPTQIAFWEGAIEAPSHEDDLSLRMPVWEVAAIESHWLPLAVPLLLLPSGTATLGCASPVFPQWHRHSWLCGCCFPPGNHHGFAGIPRQSAPASRHAALPGYQVLGTSYRLSLINHSTIRLFNQTRSTSTASPQPLTAPPPHLAATPRATPLSHPATVIRIPAFSQKGRDEESAFHPKQKAGPSGLLAWRRGRARVAQALLPVLILRHLHRVRSQEWLRHLLFQHRARCEKGQSSRVFQASRINQSTIQRLHVF